MVWTADIDRLLTTTGTYMMSDVSNALMPSPPGMPRPRRLSLHEIEQSLQQATMLGEGYARPRSEISDVTDRYTKAVDHVAGSWDDTTPWETAALHFRIANYKPPGPMPGAGETPTSDSNKRSYYPKSKYDFIDIMDITPKQGWHLSFGHELMHASKIGWDMVFDYAGWLSILQLLSLLTLSFAMRENKLAYVSIGIFMTGVIYEIWRYLPISGNYDREEASAEIGAAILATEAGVTSGFTDYSAAYVSRYLRKFTPRRRAAYVKLAYKRGAARTDFIMRRLPLG